jgi:hypothetical protein
LGFLAIANSLFGGLGQKSAERIISFAQRPTSLLVNHPLLKQMFRDHDALDLIGALVDLGALPGTSRPPSESVTVRIVVHSVHGIMASSLNL